MMCLAERRCTVSSLWILEAVCWSQMMLAHSKMGRTSSSSSSSSSSNTGKLLLEGYSQACAAKIKSKINRVK